MTGSNMSYATTSSSSGSSSSGSSSSESTTTSTNGGEPNQPIELHGLASLTQPAAVVSESFRKGVVYYNVLQKDGQLVEIMGRHLLKLMPRHILDFYERAYSWDETYNATLLQLLEETNNALHVSILTDRDNLKVQYIRGAVRTLDGLFFAVKWINVFAYDYVEESFLKEHHLEAFLIFYQGLSFGNEYCKNANAATKD